MAAGIFDIQVLQFNFHSCTFFLLFANKFYCVWDTDLLVLLQLGLIHFFFQLVLLWRLLSNSRSFSSRHNCNVYTETYSDHAICLQSLCASIARIFCGQQNAIIRSVLLLLLLLLLLRFLSICCFFSYSISHNIALLSFHLFLHVYSVFWFCTILHCRTFFPSKCQKLPTKYANRYLH